MVKKNSQQWTFHVLNRLWVLFPELAAMLSYLQQMVFPCCLLMRVCVSFHFLIFPLDYHYNILFNNFQYIETQVFIFKCWFYFFFFFLVFHNKKSVSRADYIQYKYHISLYFFFFCQKIIKENLKMYISNKYHIRVF